MSSEKPSAIPYGYCHCGCGQKTMPASGTYAKYGHVKGRPLRYINGHNPKARPRLPRIVPGPDYTKACRICGETKGILEYQRDNSARDGHRSQCRDCVHAENRRRREAAPEHTRAMTRRYNLRNRVGLDDATIAWAEVLLCDPCSYCGGPAKTLDHIVAGGPNDAGNLTAACQPCNSAKGNRPLLWLLAQRKGYWREIPPGAQVVVKGLA